MSVERKSITQSINGKKFVVIEGFVHRPGKNCGSTSLWNVSSFWGNNFPEHVIFGLSSGILFFYTHGMSASRSIGGRNPILVEDFFESIGIPRKWQKHENFPLQKIIDSVKNGIPVLARTDLYYLGYYPNPVHFPGHELVIFGYREDSEEFIVSDSTFDEPQIALRQNLENSMHPEEVKVPFFDLQNHILPVEEFKIDFSQKSVLMSIEKVVDRMTRDVDFMGLKGMRKFAQEIPEWLYVDDSAWAFRFAYQVIERRGTGGGSFRFMYSDFLKDSAEVFSGEKKKILEISSELMRESAELWRNLAFIFKDISVKIKELKENGREPSNDKEVIDMVRKSEEIAKNICDVEERCFETLKKLF